MKKESASGLWFDYIQSKPLTEKDRKMIQEFIAKQKAERIAKAAKLKSRRSTATARTKPVPKKSARA